MKKRWQFLIAFLITSLVATSQVSVIAAVFDYRNTYDIYYDVYVNNQKVGRISDLKIVDQAVQEKRAIVEAEFPNSKIYDATNYYTVTDISFKQQSVDNEIVKASLIENLDFMVDGYYYTITPDIEKISEYEAIDTNKIPYSFGVTSTDIFDEALKKYLSLYLSNSEIELINNGLEPITPKVNDSTVIDYRVVADIDVVSKKVAISELYGVNELSQLFLFGKDYDVSTYEVKKGDSLEKIALSQKVGVEDIIIANEGIINEDTLIAEGEILNIATTNPIIPIFTQEYEKLESVVPFEIEYIDDPSRYNTSPLIVKVEGQNGKQIIESNKLVVNGLETSSAELLNVNVVNPAVNKVVIRGTRKYTNSSGATGLNRSAIGDLLIPPSSALKGTNTWVRPHSGYISSGYGWRWGRLHGALDYAGKKEGSPNVATDSGYVVYRDYNPRGEGYYVVIDHGNGFYSKYSHCSPSFPIVELGTNIYQGETVCGVGNSGFSTGVHLHFQILDQNFKTVNPLSLSERFR